MATKKTAQAEVVLTLSDRLTAGINKIQARLAALSSRLGIGRIAAQVGNVGKRIADLGPALARTTRRLGLFTAAIGLGGGGAAAVAFNLARKTAEAGSELTDLSTRLGVSVEALQEFRYAANMGGMEAGNFDVALRRFVRRAAEAANGGGAAFKAFQELGISLKDANGNMRDSEVLLHEVAEALDQVPDQANKLRLAFNFFDTDGAAMVSVLAGGSDALRDWRKEARLTGNVMSTAAAKAGADFTSNIHRLTTRLEGLRTLVGVHLIPVFNDLVVRLREWYDANQVLIRSTITDWVGKFSAAIEALLDPTSEVRVGLSNMVDAVAGFYKAIVPVIDFLGGPGMSALYALGLYIGGPLVVALTTLGGAVAKLGITIMTTPFGWILGGLALLAGSVYVLIQRWDDFVAYWTGLWGRITDAFDRSWTEGILTAFLEFQPVTHIVRGLDAVIEYFTGFSFLDAGAALLQTLWDGFTDSWSRVWPWLLERVSDLLDVFNIDLFAIGEAIVRSLLDGLKSAWGALTGWVTSSATALGQNIVSAVDPRNWFGGSDDTASGSSESVLHPSLPVIHAPQTPWSPAQVSAAPGESGQVSADTVQAETVQTGEIVMPEPITMSHAQNVDARVTNNVTINGSGLSETQLQNAVSGALRQASQGQQADTLSSLND